MKLSDYLKRLDGVRFYEDDRDYSILLKVKDEYTTSLELCLSDGENEPATLARWEVTGYQLQD